MSQTKAGSMIAMSASNRIGKPAGTLGTPEAARITDTTGHLPRPHRCNFESRATCSIWPKHFDGMGAFLAMPKGVARSEEHTSELQSLVRTSYAVFCLKKNTKTH